ncbi:MAG TPA: hypothetical protein VF557_09400 [Jatrophihabitans sp.]|uniref:hypothetical protein n=1 Tax=Jatrophihabitans sp. TaxID=1932789 RepID=UPI002EF67CBF
MRPAAAVRPRSRVTVCVLALAVMAGFAASGSAETVTGGSGVRLAGVRTQYPVDRPVLVRPGRLPLTRPRPTGSASIAGCPLFPPDNPWRRVISSAPLHPRSAAWVANIGSSRFLHPDFGSDPSYGIPYSVVPASQPKVPISFTAYGDESDPGPYPIPPGARIEAGGDAHVLVASADCHLYELYGAARSGSGWTAQSGAVFDLRSNALRPAGWTSADAAGLPILPGLVRRDEVLAGRIDHALRFTISTTQRGYISPATHQAGSTSDPNFAPMGARFRLKASFDISRYSGAARVILQCLKTYGMFVADNGSNWFISGATDSGWDDLDLRQLKQVPGSAFEAVDTGPVRS